MNKKNLTNFFSVEKTSSKIILIGIFLLSSFLLFLPVFIDIDYKAFLAFGMIGLFIINFLGSATLFLPAPAIVSVAIGGASFNPLIVALIAGIASSLGESTGFLFGYSSMKFLSKKNNHKIFLLTKKLVHFKGGILIPAFAFIPNPFFDGFGILAGISNFPITRFIFLTFLGRFMRNIGIAYLGLFLS